jgi:hexosaminidase
VSQRTTGNRYGPKRTMKIKTPLATIFLGIAVISSALAEEAKMPAIIPLPQKLEMQSGVFKLTRKTRILVDSDSTRDTANCLAEKLRASTGFPFVRANVSGSDAKIKNAILFSIENVNTNLGAEGYSLNVTRNGVVIRASTQAGLFYGAQTLLQLLPPEIFSTKAVKRVKWQMPCAQIEDWPRFKWRGLMLDVARHFFNKSEVERILDTMALYKLNTFHWHLTDDQGWRIEIEKYPKLTEIGGWRSGVGFNLDPKSTTAYGPDGRYGGFYTQNDIREIVAYAAARHITIVPEIEMPGHSTAALAAYPEYSCTGGPFINATTAGVFNGIYNPANEKTFTFLENILSEVFKLFPGKYIHIGGDEVPKATWKNSADCQALMRREGLKDEKELQSWFIRRIENFVSANGRSMIGWSEILEGGLPRNAAVMDWIGGAQEAASAGHNIVMSPVRYCYLDFYQSTNHAAEPTAASWGPGTVTLKKVYSFNPSADLPPQSETFILGTQGNLWTEQISNLKYAEYMIFPREFALAEIGWSSELSRDWNDFLSRLTVNEKRLKEIGMNFRPVSDEPAK